MDSTPVSKKSIGRDTSGIALFMVIAAVGVLTILVTEFTYIAQISQAIAFGGLDQAKAHYLAKSGLKLSLLRLKAYKQVKNMTTGAGAIPGIPRSLVEKIWNFPFFYPIPTNIPGMSVSDKDAVEKFQKESNLEGTFSALIESESSKYNLNLLLSNYALPAPFPSGSPTPSPTGSPPPKPAFNAKEARDSLTNYLGELLNQQIEADPDFADHYRDLNLEDLVDSIAAWEDRTFLRRSSNSHDPVPVKGAPFYSLTELQMISNMDDELYKIFTPNLTAGLTQGININTMQEPILRALIPVISKEEVQDFFKFRDSVDVDNQFADTEKFFSYLSKGITAFRNDPQSLTELKNDLTKRNINLITDESEFKITVRAEVNHASRTIEAWVTLNTSTPKPPLAGGALPPDGQPLQPPPRPDSGLRITFMRIL